MGVTEVQVYHALLSIAIVFGPLAGILATIEVVERMMPLARECANAFIALLPEHPPRQIPYSFYR